MKRPKSIPELPHVTTKECRQTVGEGTNEFELTKAERTEFERAAKKADLTLAEWIRERLVRAAKREAKGTSLRDAPSSSTVNNRIFDTPRPRRADTRKPIRIFA